MSRYRSNVSLPNLFLNARMKEVNPFPEIFSCQITLPYRTGPFWSGMIGGGVIKLLTWLLVMSQRLCNVGFGAQISW